MTEVAEELSLNPGMLHSWVSRAGAATDVRPPGGRVTVGWAALSSERLCLSREVADKNWPLTEAA
ncbi:hypothetical protein OG930_02630 [Streptomyces sp. NBC_01799]|uniref:hypothetical protein n=1 Tax=Streptomyces sp. NBC_01800 TaxID=2975945 RepID=UPI002DDBAA2D|nr:hypothetical protein [Streptomyces sp. NBC_01800]WSA66001.1 hypothetical protein OIE65_02710 [Streptomyces sp. NBC_01800]WSA74604.1 hypothetical protein OG930_02630 [Streptomyces sp. NBC_01799]